jgi:hypothetical protein
MYLPEDGCILQPKYVAVLKPIIAQLAGKNSCVQDNFIEKVQH